MITLEEDFVDVTMRLERYSQCHNDDNREEAEEGNAGNETLAGLYSNEEAGAGVGEVEHVSRGAGLYGVQGTVALAGVGVPHLVRRDTVGPLPGVVTDTPEVTNCQPHTVGILTLHYF